MIRFSPGMTEHHERARHVNKKKKETKGLKLIDFCRPKSLVRFVAFMRIISPAVTNTWSSDVISTRISKIKQPLSHAKNTSVTWYVLSHRPRGLLYLTSIRPMWLHTLVRGVCRYKFHQFAAARCACQPPLYKQGQFTLLIVQPKRKDKRE